MKTFIALCLCLFTVAAVAQNERPTAVILTTQSSVAASNTTLFTNVVADCRQDTTPVQIKFAMTAACTSNMTFVFARSVDGSNYETTSAWSIPVTANGTTPVIYVTNLSTPTLKNFKLVSIANAHDTVVLTNLTIHYNVKR